MHTKMPNVKLGSGTVVFTGAVVIVNFGPLSENVPRSKVIPPIVWARIPKPAKLFCSSTTFLRNEVTSKSISSSTYSGEILPVSKIVPA